MDAATKARLRREFPGGEEWGWGSFMADHPVFWNSDDHVALTQLSDKQILIALMWKTHFALQFGQQPHLYFDEKKLWRKHFATITKMAALLVAIFFLYHHRAVAPESGETVASEICCPLGCDCVDSDCLDCR